MHTHTHTHRTQAELRGCARKHTGSTDGGESFQASAVPTELRAVVATPGGGFVALTLAGALLSSPQVR